MKSGKYRYQQHYQRRGVVFWNQDPWVRTSTNCVPDNGPLKQYNQLDDARDFDLWAPRVSICEDCGELFWDYNNICGECGRTICEACSPYWSPRLCEDCANPEVEE